MAESPEGHANAGVPRPDPSLEAEVAEYAEYLGMAPGEDAELLWVAESALLTPPPEGWRVVYDHTKRPFFLHAETGEAQWAHPFDDDWRALADGLRAALNDEPVTKEDVEAMAAYLGIDAAKEPGLMWIAQHATAAPLPPPWEEREVGDQRVFVDADTGVAQHEHPLDDTFRALLARERVRLQQGRFSFARAGAIGMDPARCPMRLWDVGPDGGDGALAATYVYDWASGERVSPDAAAPAAAPSVVHTVPAAPSTPDTAASAASPSAPAPTPPRRAAASASLTTRSRAFVKPPRSSGTPGRPTDPSVAAAVGLAGAPHPLAARATAAYRSYVSAPLASLARFLFADEPRR